MGFLDSSDRTEPASARKKQEAREHGQVARSQDLSTALVLLAACLGLHFFGLPSLQKLAVAMVESLRRMGRAPLDVSAAVEASGYGLLLGAEVILPLAALLFSVGVAGNLLQVGFLVSGHPVAPDLNRLDPFRGLTRIFSLRGLFRGSFGLLKLSVVGWVLAYTIWNELAGPHSPGAAALLSGTVGQAAARAIQVGVEMGLKAGVAILALALLDYCFQRWLHERDLRMTKAELKEELRRMEGDPRIRERRRRVLEQLAHQRMMRDVPKADVVVTNPTHLAVAIRYDRLSMAAPRVVAKGEGPIAERIRQLAMENEVPVVERRELARALYAAVEVGQEIPAELYKTVAELLAYVYRMSGKAEEQAPELEGAGAGGAAGGGRRGAGERRRTRGGPRSTAGAER
jgi:flagellar biosynthetic protein FlhB